MSMQTEAEILDADGVALVRAACDAAEGMSLLAHLVRQ